MNNKKRKLKLQRLKAMKKKYLKLNPLTCLTMPLNIIIKT